jgi:peroxiredoxin
VRRLFLLLSVFLGLTLLGCSPRNGLEIPGDDDDSGAPATCGSTDNAWPSVLPEYADYEGEGAQTGDHLLNFTLTDQHDQSMCLSQLLGHVLIIDASTRWCGPCNEAAAESAVLWEEMKEIGPSFITTLMVQDGSGLPATLVDAQWWADTYDIEYPVVVDNAGQTATAWGVTNYPVFLFVAPTGEVVERWEQKPAESDVLSFVAFAVEEWADDLRQSIE